MPDEPVKLKGLRREIDRNEFEELGALQGGDSPPASLRSVLLDSLLFYWGRNEPRREGTWELMGPVLAAPKTICPRELLTGSL